MYVRHHVLLTLFCSILLLCFSLLLFDSFQFLNRKLHDADAVLLLTRAQLPRLAAHSRCLDIHIDYTLLVRYDTYNILARLSAIIN